LFISSIIKINIEVLGSLMKYKIFFNVHGCLVTAAQGDYLGKRNINPIKDEKSIPI